MKVKVRADMIKRALSKRHHEDFFLTEVKTGPTHYGADLHIIDALAIKKSWANPCITAYEIKVDRSDFTRDEKWMAYLQYCHQFAFVCPKGLIQPEELPDEVGLVYYKPETGSLFTMRKPSYRQVTIPSNMLMYIIMSRLDNERHPFFSSQREYIEAYLQDKDERKEIGERFGIKVTEEIGKLRRELERLSDRKEKLQRLKEVSDILREYGIWIDGWGTSWKEELRKALANGLDPRIESELQYLLKRADVIKKMLDERNAEQCSTA
ncbi:MAG: hypothetical protein C6W55_10410 [Thermobacillus sp.]|uniref:MmcB family DNA repair protein n=1 Tax=Thermobacillus sp. TaxID=2108467 RepID=UPI000E377A2A|nr:MmcB family DNA repair protein [Thermobacillus sp.]REK54735.1 MAG: hypothetical protein C6W55_10410 [Thermobacillus sp.]